MKEGKCFNYKRKRHTMLNYPEKAKLSVISGTSNIDNIEDIDQEKE